jgi:hypothetical protein
MAKKSKVVRNVLLVEGFDDLYVTANIWKKHFATPKTIDHISIKDMNGVDLVQTAIKTELAGSGLENLGIVVDADDQLDVRWKTISTTLTQAGYSVPLLPEKTGTIIQELNKPTVGVWLMPDNRLRGRLEDFLLYLIPDPANDNLWFLSEKCVNEALLLDPQIPPGKARIHTYLAWKKDAGLPFGDAIAHSYFDTNKPEAILYLEWLKALFPVP